MLTAIGLGTTFYKPKSWPGRSATRCLGTVFTVVAQGALNVLLNALSASPTLTFPFVVAAWLFLLPNLDLLPPPTRRAIPRSESVAPPHRGSQTRFLRCSVTAVSHFRRPRRAVMPSERRSPASLPRAFSSGNVFFHGFESTMTRSIPHFIVLCTALGAA